MTDVPSSFYQDWKESWFRPHHSFGAWREKQGEHPILVTRDYWLLFIVVEGRCGIESHGISQTLEGGDMVVISPSKHGCLQSFLNDDNKILRIPMEWVPNIAQQRHPLEKLPLVQPVPHPNPVELKQCFDELYGKRNSDAEDHAWKMKGGVWLMRLLSLCIQEGFRTDRYTLKTTPSQTWIDELAKEWRQRYKEPHLKLDEFAAKYGRSVRRIHQAFKEHYRESPLNYLNRYRVLIALRLLESNPHHKVDHLLTRVGFKNRRQFYDIFKRYTGKVPSDFRNK